MLRNQSPELSDGRLEQVAVKFDEDAQWLTMSRGAITTVVNFSQTAQNLLLANSQSHKLLLASRSGVVLDAGSATMPAESAAIVRIG
jgi:maltooligosyltrehalose trehalohydrolase